MARKWEKKILTPRENKEDDQLYSAAGNSSYHVAFENSIESNISRLINGSSNKQWNLSKRVTILTQETFWTYKLNGDIHNLFNDCHDIQEWTFKTRVQSPQISAGPVQLQRLFFSKQAVEWTGNSMLQLFKEESEPLLLKKGQKNTVAKWWR